MAWYLGTAADGTRVELDGDDLTTHGVVVGMTGSGKTGLGIICLEEARLAGVPVLVIDPKGDMGNLALVFPELAPADFEPWVDPAGGEDRAEVAAETAARWTDGLERSGIHHEQLSALAASPVTVYTPGSTAGVPLSLLGSLAPPVEANDESIREEARALVSSILLLADIEADPIADPRHVLLATLVEQAWIAGEALDFETLIARTLDPPMRKLGVFELDRFIDPGEREGLAMRLNGVLASPTAAAWREGEPLDLDRMLTNAGKPGAAVVSVAHLDDASRQFVVATVMAKAVSWARRQAGTERLRLLIYMDEVFGFVPPSANPPAKQPILTLLKQGRAHGVGLLLATQNPMDLDYKAMSNAGTWLIGRLQTERDQARILEGMATAGGEVDVDALSDRIAGLDEREFVLHSTRAEAPLSFSTRWAMSYLAGPLSRDGLERLRGPLPVSTEPPTMSGPAIADDAVTIAPEVAEAANPAHLHPATPWLDLVGARGTGTRLEPAVAARVDLRFDDRYAGVDHAEEWEAILHPLPKATDPGLGVAVDHDDRDFTDDPPAGATYQLPIQPIDQPSYWRDLGASLKATLVAERSVTVWKNPDLKVYSRVGESKDDFLARCGDAAEAAADEALAKLKDRYETKVRTARERLRTAEARADALEVDLRADQQEELAGGLGDLLGAFAGGRSTSAGLRRIARRRAEIDRTELRLDEAEATVVARMEAIAAIEDDLAADVTGITDEWARKAEAIEAVTIGLEKSDVRVTDLRLVWLPMARP